MPNIFYWITKALLTKVISNIHNLMYKLSSIARNHVDVNH